MPPPRVEDVSDSDDDDDAAAAAASPASDPDEGDIDDFVDADILRRVAPRAPAPAPAPAPAHDPAAYRGFQSLYPVYFDATRSRADGRRVAAALAVRNPLARDIADACSRLGLRTLLEPDKVHPKDWANPGRVKVGLKAARPAAPARNKHHLYRLVARHLALHPTHDASPGLRLRVAGQLQPPDGKPYPRPAVPRGWKMGDLLPYLSPAMTGGGVSENLFKDMMKEMQAGADPMAALMAGPPAPDDGGAPGRKKKDKKGKGRA